MQNLAAERMMAEEVEECDKAEKQMTPLVHSSIILPEGCLSPADMGQGHVVCMSTEHNAHGESHFMAEFEGEALATNPLEAAKD